MDALAVDRLAAARELFAPARAYLNTATMGLPPQPAWDALQAALESWRRGDGDMAVYDAAVARSRQTFARLVNVEAGDVAVGSQVSVFVGMVAASLPDGTRVLCAEEDFTSLLFPFLAQRPRIEVTCVPLAEIVDAIDQRTDLVAVSAVQSADGRVLDLDALAAAAERHGVSTLVDASQACGWLPVDARRFDYVVAGAYKWLLSPRGTAFMAVRPDRVGDIRPLAAGWYAGQVVADSYYGPPLRLAGSARRLDVSPAWLCWVGATPALELLAEVGVAAIRDHNVALANRFRAGVGLGASDSAIVSVETADGMAERLAAAGVRASVRAGGLRLAFHLYNSEADVDRALDVLAG